MKELSGDIKLNRGSRIWYLGMNAIRGIWGYRIRIPTRFWISKNVSKGPNSPSRKYVDAFLVEMLPRFLPSSSPLNVLDIGCGSGYIRKILADLGYDVVYTGIDIVRHKDFDKFISYTTKSRFIKSPIEDIQVHEEFDFVVSMEALEHISDDKQAIKIATKSLKKGGVQIHIIPSFWSLPLYLWHGYRQYTPAQLRLLFFDPSTIFYRLGGIFSFFIHFLFITIWLPFSFQNIMRNSSLYNIACSVALRLDRMIPFGSVIYVAIIKKES